MLGRRAAFAVCPWCVPKTVQVLVTAKAESGTASRLYGRAAA
jgi:hypothetical protein